MPPHHVQASQTFESYSDAHDMLSGVLVPMALFPRELMGCKLDLYIFG